MLIEGDLQWAVTARVGSDILPLSDRGLIETWDFFNSIWESNSSKPLANGLNKLRFNAVYLLLAVFVL